MLYEGEGHMFTKAENIKDMLVKELAFYQDVFGLKTQKAGWGCSVQ